MSIPVIKRDPKGIPTLYVHDKPFFMRSGEIHNSSASNAAFLEDNLWPALRGLSLNAVIVPLYWELIEPKEGKYDFSTVDALISSARWEGLKLCFLWFGLWKNAESFYVPAWMKKDIIIGTAMDISSGRTAIVPMRFCCSLRFSVIFSSLTALF